MPSTSWTTTSKNGKYLREYLDPEQWETLLRTYSDADEEDTWVALHTMCNLFRRLAVDVAGHFGYEYPHQDDERVSAHLLHVERLPRDAEEIY